MFSSINIAWNECLIIRRECKKVHAKRSLYSIFLIVAILRNLKLPNHDKVQKYANALIEFDDFSGYFYLANSYFLQNDLKKSEECLQKFIEKYPNQADSHYLLAQIEELTNRKQQAKERLLNLLANSPRKKTWQILSNLVNSSVEFCEYEAVFKKYYPQYQKETLPYDLICHLSNAAQRGNCDDFALELWKNQYRLVGQKPQNKNTPITPSKQYTDKSASIALRAIKQCFDDVDIPIFLISGTLLGCIREGKLLGHDKDIDIGVWDTYTVDELANIIRNSGCFYILTKYSKDILVVRHVNGVTIDIFIHYRESDDYWHAGGKSSWHNTPFNLIPYHFLGDKYLIPENYDLYLTENYGNDWFIPKIDFDSALDTPNMRVIDAQKMLIYFYKKLLNGNFDSSKDSIIRMKNVLSLNTA